MNYTTYKSNLTRIDSRETVMREFLSFRTVVLCNVTGITLKTALTQFRHFHILKKCVC